MEKLRVGVFMGGKSIEAEVSFNSGRTVCDHLDTTRYTIIPIFQKKNGTLYILPLRFLHRGKISDFEQRLDTQAQKISWDDLKNLLDFAYIALHGRYAEDGTLQGILEILNIPYLGSKIFGSALSMDKIMQKKIMRSAHIKVPHGAELYPHEIHTLTKKEALSFLNGQNLTFPLIIKPNKEGSSLGVSMVKTIEDLIPAMKHAATIHAGHNQPILIEEKITGMEFSCIILTDYQTGQPILLPPTEIALEQKTDFFDYTQKYMPGRTQKFTPARCAPEIIEAIQKTCLQVMNILELQNFARIDGFVTLDSNQTPQIIIIDPNALSGMGPSSFLFREAAEVNMNHTQVINHLIETELHHYRMLLPKKQEKLIKMAQKDTLRVAVLLGGNSAEKEISLESGRNILYKLAPQKYEAIPIFVNHAFQLYQIDTRLLIRNSTSEIERELTQTMHIPWNDLGKLCDFVFIGLHGGNGENGAIQGTLEMLGLPYNGSSVLASALCMDKFKTNQFLKTQGFDVPHGILLAKDTWQANTALEHLTYPLIAKPHNEGCSVGVTKVSTKKELIKNIKELFESGKTHILIEEYITGLELTVGVIGNELPNALVPSQAIASQGILTIEEKFLPGAGENQTPAPLPTKALQFVQKTVAAAYKTVGCKGYARIDCFYQSPQESPTGKERCIIIEINTLPGLTPATCIFHQAAECVIKP
ncbi:MAG: ATP-grasp domain-containing protein, partial [Candidatus Babeliales bacterium]